MSGEQTRFHLRERQGEQVPREHDVIVTAVMVSTVESWEIPGRPRIKADYQGCLKRATSKFMSVPRTAASDAERWQATRWSSRNEGWTLPSRPGKAPPTPLFQDRSRVSRRGVQLRASPAQQTLQLTASQNNTLCPQSLFLQHKHFFQKHFLYHDDNILEDLLKLLLCLYFQI